MSQESLEKRIAALEKEIARLKAVNEIQNLVGKYAVLHTPKSFARTPELFALKQPDVSVEIAMWGVYIGAEQIKNVYQKMMVEPLVGSMFEHQFTTPMIEVAGDGQTARGLWYSPGHETQVKDGTPEAYWCWGKYEADFIKEGGEWKIWHWRFFDTFMCPYHKSWVEVEPPPIGVIAGPRADEYPPDKPTTYRSSYFKTGIREPIPSWPEPYDAWSK